MYQRRYDKAYLMLRQESSGYGIGHRAPWGSCTMEIKNGIGQLRLQVQGLISLHNKGYTVYALAEKEEECHAICCGQLLIDKHGTGMLTWEFSADDLDGIYQVEDLFAITILTPSGDKMAAPLTAYFGTPRKWLSRLHLPQSTEQADLIAAEAAVRPTMLLDTPEPPASKNKTALPFADSVIKPQTTTDQTETKAAENSTSYHGNFRGLLQKFRQEMQDLTDMGILSEEESSRILGYRSKDTAVCSSNPATIEREREQENTIKEENTDSLSQEMVSQDTSYDSSEQETPSQECTCNTISEQAISPEEIISDTTPETDETEKPDETVSLPQPQNNPQSEQEQTRARAAALQNCTPEAEASPCPQDTFFAALEILRSRPAMTPFSDKCTWRCITLQDLVLFPAVPLYWQKEPFFLLTMAKYGHLLLRREGEHFLIGVPDTYTPENTPYAKQFGLSTFQKLDKEHPEGYWLGILPEESGYK